MVPVSTHLLWIVFDNSLKGTGARRSSARLAVE